MRIYRLQIRIIQLSVLLTLIVMVFGLVSIWQGTSDAEPAGGDNTVQQGDQNSGDPETDGGNGDSNDQTNDQLANTKIVCIGDSYTYGYPGEPKDSWPDKLAGILKIEVVNAGKVYQNTADLLGRFDQDVVAKEPGRVVIFAGVGDALREKTLEEYQKNLKAMVEKAEANHIKPILALPIPYPGTDKLYKQYLDWETTFAQEKNITILDFKDVLCDADGKILNKYSNDGKYPNKDGYQAMAEYAAGVLQ